MFVLTSQFRELIEAGFTMPDVAKALAFSGKSSLARELVLEVAAQSHCQENGIEIGPGALAKEINSFRMRNKLYTAEATKAWLTGQGLTDEDLERWALRQATTKVFIESIADNAKIDRYYSFNKLKFDEAELYKIAAPSQATAQELKMQILEGESFFALAKQYSLDDKTRNSCGHLGWVRRDAMSADLEAQVFNNESPRIIGPLKEGGEYNLYWVEAVARSELTKETKEEIVDYLVDEWLADSLPEKLRFILDQPKMFHPQSSKL